MTGLTDAALEHAARALAAAFMRAFEIPGLAVAMVRPNEAPIAFGLGVRAIGETDPVDLQSRFAIASLSKAFLATCLAIEVDHGRIGWDDPITRYLPEFRMSDPAVTRMMTIRDLLVHRSGLPLGAGDLMIIRGGDATAARVMAALPHFPAERGFRGGYAYDNCLYIVAGLLLERVSGLSWNDYVSRNIFAPLGMARAVPNPSLSSPDNRVARHARLGPPVIGMGSLERVEPQESDVNGPAGGIQMSIGDILPWIAVQLARGRTVSGEQLWSEAQATEMWRPQTIIASSPGPTPAMPQRAVIEGYALGWGVNDYRGNRMLTHAGQLAGATSRLALLPDRGAGIAIFSNSSDAEPVSALRYALLDLVIGADSFDWIGYAQRTIADLRGMVAEALDQGVDTDRAPARSLALDRYTGRYRDPWYGDIVVTRSGETLHICFEPTPDFSSMLEPFGADAFRTRFPRGVGEDAVVEFAVDGEAVTGITMRALSPLADFSFDFHHLSFTPVEPGADEAISIGDG